ncbi:Adaptin N terminal region family protein [Tritrichomonas foetus]|uniref:Adaptin N terminal region family protein n=1 Tax=Tritrichomonas foetus TaxID=1144522 RepID=A0A1J4KDC5_9EUKA|nr:Adaptin N terminal region family protein [Tritrichomonas foetus]|eukprot:OHT07461.1 Adaptin N terminal region family protein [Tritrichomonas foetus]
MSSAIKKAAASATKNAFFMLSRGTGLKSFVDHYHESKQRGIVNEFISEVVNSSKEIFASGTQQQQADCLQEMLFLQMQGHDMSWVDFNISNLMPSDDYSVKYMSYMAASSLWNPDSEAIFMSTNCIKRDLGSSDPLNKALALSLVSQIATSDLASSVVSDVVSAFNHSRSEISQMSICAFYQICLKYPDALRAGFQSLNVKYKLEEGDPGTQQAVLTLLNELCIHNPSNFMNFVPILYKLLTNAATPWILVRTLSIFTMILASLKADVAAKLASRLVQPIAEILDTASSASVVLEVIRLICDGPLRSPHLIRVAADRAQDFIQSPDPNLRYLGLTSMTRLMKIDQKVIALHREIISGCLESDDPTCVVIAIDLLQAIATRKNLPEFVLKLLEQIQIRQPGFVRDALVSRVIQMCCHNDYERVVDFEWYMNILLEIHSYGIHSKELSQQLLTIALRVESVRPELINEMLEIMKQPNTADTDMIETASFILGEYSLDCAEEAFGLLLNSKIQSVGPSAQASCIQNAFKLYAKSPNEEIMCKRGNVLIEKLPPYAASRFTEVQERVSMLLSLVSIFQIKPDVSAVSSLYSVPLKAIATTAQSKVPIPKSLDLSIPIIDLEAAEQSFDFIDELGFDSFLNNGPDPSIFILGSSKRQRPNPNLNKSNVIVMSGSSLGVDIQPKKRRLLPVKESRGIELLPLEGADHDTPKQNKNISALAKIDITAPLRANEKLPELLPYSQDELIQKQSKQMLPNKNSQLSRTGNNAISLSDYSDYFHQVGSVQGINLVIEDIAPRQAGLEINVAVTNSSSIPISAVEFVLDDGAPQCLRSEISANDVGRHKLILRCETFE